MIKQGQTVMVTRENSAFYQKIGTVEQISFLSGEPRYLISFTCSPFVYGFNECHLEII